MAFIECLNENPDIALDEESLMNRHFIRALAIPRSLGNHETSLYSRFSGKRRLIHIYFLVFVLLVLFVLVDRVSPAQASSSSSLDHHRVAIGQTSLLVHSGSTFLGENRSGKQQSGLKNKWNEGGKRL